MFDAIQIAYWLALSTWFGGVLFVAISAGIIFRVVREADPTLPRVLSVNLDGQHSTLLAGSIVSALLGMVMQVQLICAGFLLIALLAQWFLIDLSGPKLFAPIVRSVLFIVAVVLAVYNWRVVMPRVHKHRQEYIDHADEPDIANPAKSVFDRYHEESVTILGAVLFVLLGMILFSANIRPAGFTLTP